MGGNNYESESINNVVPSESASKCVITGRITGRSQADMVSRSEPVPISMSGSGCCGGKPASECCITVDSLQVAANKTISGMTVQECQDSLEKYEACIDDLLDAFTAAIRDFLEVSKAYPNYQTPGPLALENLADSLIDNFLTTMNLLTSLADVEAT